MQMHMERADDDEHVRRIGGTGNAVVGDCVTFEIVEDTANASAYLWFERIMEAIATNVGPTPFVRLREARRSFVMVLRREKMSSKPGESPQEMFGDVVMKTAARRDGRDVEE